MTDAWIDSKGGAYPQGGQYQDPTYQAREFHPADFPAPGCPGFDDLDFNIQRRIISHYHNMLSQKGGMSGKGAQSAPPPPPGYPSYDTPTGDFRGGYSVTRGGNGPSWLQDNAIFSGQRQDYWPSREQQALQPMPEQSYQAWQHGASPPRGPQQGYNAY